MTIDEIIHDLQAFVDYFEENNDAHPVCMVEAIEVLEQVKNIVERR